MVADATRRANARVVDVGVRELRLEALDALEILGLDVHGSGGERRGAKDPRAHVVGRLERRGHHDRRAGRDARELGGESETGGHKLQNHLGEGCVGCRSKTRRARI